MPDNSTPPWWADEDPYAPDPPAADDVTAEGPKTPGDPWAAAEAQLAEATARAIDQVAADGPVVGRVIDTERTYGDGPLPGDPEPDDTTYDDQPQLSPREESARRLTTIAALEKWLAKLKAQEKSDGAWTRAGQKETVALPTGEELGNTRTDPVAGGWKIKDAGTYLAWMAKHYPEHVRPVDQLEVDPAFTKDLLAKLTPDGEWIDNAELGTVAQAPPGLEYVPAGYKIVTTAHKDAPAAVAKYMATAVPQLQLPELEAGK